MFFCDIPIIYLFFAFVVKRSMRLSKEILRRRDQGVMRNACARAHGLGRLNFCSFLHVNVKRDYR